MCPALPSALLSGNTLFCSSGSCGEFLLLFGFHGNCSYEAEQFPAECCDDLVLVLAAGRKALIALVQPMLRFPCNILHFIGQCE